MNDPQKQAASIPDETLTQRELEIVSLIAAGHTNREIGTSLHLAETTVRWHNTQIFAKLGVKNRHEAVARAQELGLLRSEVQAASVSLHNLPRQTTLFVGRHQELSELAHLLGDKNVPLITILGAGGMGKTRLALEVARTHLRHFSDGVYFVPLASLSSAEHIIAAIAEQVGFQFGDDRHPKEQLLRFFARKRLLLVLDNFEHLLKGAHLAAEILGAAPDVTILATSREKLALNAETVFSVIGMPFPDRNVADDIQSYSAVGLFIQSAQRTRSDFTLHADDLRHVARICQLVEGMPLAILLAASWVDVLSLEEIADELSQSLDILQTELRDIPAHQRSIRTTIDRSWNQLSASDQDIFMRLSVFHGGCTRSAIEAVAGARLSHLQRLVNRSLLWYMPDGRYNTHELLRQYAEEQLIQSGDSDAVRKAHASYYADFLEERWEPLTSQHQRAAMLEIRDEFENVRAAWLVLIENQQMADLDRCADSLFFFGLLRGWPPHVKDLLSRAVIRLESMPSSPDVEIVRGQLLGRLAWFYSMRGSPIEGKEAAERGLHLLKPHDDQSALLRAYVCLAMACHFRGDFEGSREALTAGLELAKAIGDHSWWVVTAHWYLARATSSGMRDLSDEGRRIAKEYRQLAEERGGPHDIGGAYLMLAVDLSSRGEHDEARYLIHLALQIYIDNENPELIALAIGGLGNLASVEGNYAEAWDYGLQALERTYQEGRVLQTLWGLGNLIEILAQTGDKQKVVELCALVSQHPIAIESQGLHPIFDNQLRHELEMALTPEDYKAAWERGQQLDLDTVVTELLSDFED